MKPNIILITTDQQRKDSLGCYGADYVKTPHLDQLANEGVRFERAYCANPVCTPSRASILTGLQVSNHGAWNIGTALPKEIPNLADLLGENGYYCHSVGKCHWQPQTSQDSHESLGNPEFFKDWHGPYYGFDTLDIAIGHPGYDTISGHYADWLRKQADGDDDIGKLVRTTEANFGCEAWDREIPTRWHCSTWCGDRAIDFIERQKKRQPFFLNIGFPDPHHPHAVPTDYENRVAPEKVPQPHYVEGELDDKPFFFKEAHEGRLKDSSTRGEFPMAGQGDGFDYTNIPPEEASNARAYYYTMVQMIDDQIGRLRQCLETEGLLDNTIIVFTTDHGELLGDHGIWMKGPFHYEELINVPLIIRSPARLSIRGVSDRLVSLIDLCPTLLDMVDVSPPKVDGLSLGKNLESGIEGPVRDHVLVECFDDLAGLRLRTLITDGYKITCYEEQDFGELYDLTNDPDELINLWEQPEHAGLRALLENKLLDATPNSPRFEERLVYS